MISSVYMNQGRWVVDCPHPECTWAYTAMTPDGRPRYLHACRGDRTGKGCGTLIELEWPPVDAALEIELALYRRPAPMNRNWRPPETVDSLLRENDMFLVGWTLADLAEKGIGTV